MHTYFIQSQQEMDSFLQHLAGHSLLAVDTEFFRETTYYPQLGLVQLATSEQVACIDPLAFDARDSLATCLLDKSITKVFHSCSQDMEVLLHYLGELPCPLVDTQIAAAMLGEKDQISYAEMVATHMDIELEKSQTRTNWLKRPLSQKQLQYAAEDVLYLIPVYQQLAEQLKQKGRLNWLQYDCEQLCQSSQRYMPDFDNCWLRVKGTQKLSAKQLGIVDALARWREHKAIALNRTRKQVLSDDFIVQASSQQPDSIEQLQRCGKAARDINHGDFNTLLQLINTTVTTDPASWPSHPRYRLDSNEKQLLRDSMQSLEHKAKELGVAQAVLGSRKEIEKMIHGQRQLNLLSDWRYHCIGKQLLDQLGNAIS